ncbi:Methylated-DNA--protein-cysteine methyltransferase [Planctomycetes bacterium MalM25]|nr:Methylated-DNA--protein-cysteine methyltransferase [Planctomycetes bacterium MalM25]
MTDRSDRLVTSRLDSPIGPLLLGAVGRSLCLVEYAEESRAERQLRRVGERMGLGPCAGSSVAIDQTAEQLAEFFAGKRQGFSIPLELMGTPFQQSVWAELLKIPPGETRSYGQIARALGDPAATRAVGAANGANPISILVPCHRVVRTGGALGGYGGGLDRKSWLLDHEQRMAGVTLFA